MANTFSHCFYHIVFSTKNRVNFIRPEIEDRVWAYIGGIARKHNLTALQIGGIDDHVHALISSPPTIDASKIAKYLKGDSSFGSIESFRNYKNFHGRMGTECSPFANRIRKK